MSWHDWALLAFVVCWTTAGFMLGKMHERHREPRVLTWEDVERALGARPITTTRSMTEDL